MEYTETFKPKKVSEGFCEVTVFFVFLVVPLSIKPLWQIYFGVISPPEEVRDCVEFTKKFSGFSE